MSGDLQSDQIGIELTPDPNADAFTWHEDRCKSIYREAHIAMASKYNNLEHQCNTRANKQQDGHAHQGIHLARTQTIATQRTDPALDGWFDSDRKLFSAMDADGNHFLDKEEFKEFVKKNFEMNADEAKKVLELYDVDHKKTIGIFEFCQMMAVWHTQHAWQAAKYSVKYEGDILEDTIPCSCCDGLCIKFATHIGCSCSLCTLCLSWIPCYCILMATDCNIEDLEKAHQKAIATAAKEAKASTKKKLLKGPPGNVLKASDCAKVKAEQV